MRLVEYRNRNSVHRTALVTHEGRRWLHAVLIDSPVRLHKLPLTEQRYMTDVAGYPITRAKQVYRRAGKALGITKGARRALRARG